MIRKEEEKEIHSTVNLAKIQLSNVVTDRYMADTKDRKWLSKWVAIVVSVWLVMVYFLLIENNTIAHLSDGVLIALITTTTLNYLVFQL
jgi:hypothetical protein